MAEIFFFNKPARSASKQTTMAPTNLVPLNRQRRARTKFSKTDIALLEETFSTQPYPDVFKREDLADKIGVSEARIQTWFQNKRSRSKRRTNSKPSPKQAVQSLPTQPGSTPEPMAHPETPNRNVSPQNLPQAAWSPCDYNSPLDLSTQGFMPAKVPLRTPSRIFPDQGLDLSMRSKIDDTTESQSLSPNLSPSPVCVSPTEVRGSPNNMSQLLTLPNTPLPMATYPAFSPLSPWLYGCISLHELNTPFMTDPSLQYLVDALQNSPGLSPLVSTNLASSPSVLSPSIRSEGIFVFPPIQNGAIVISPLE